MELRRYRPPVLCSVGPQPDWQFRDFRYAEKATSSTQQDADVSARLNNWVHCWIFPNFLRVSAREQLSAQTFQVRWDGTGKILVLFGLNFWTMPVNRGCGRCTADHVQTLILIGNVYTNKVIQNQKRLRGSEFKITLIVLKVAPHLPEEKFLRAAGAHVCDNLSLFSNS